eukprot:75674_1
MSDKTVNEMKDSQKHNKHNQYYIHFNRFILFYTFIGVTYLLFLKSVPNCGCQLANNISTNKISLTNRNISINNIPMNNIPISSIPITSHSGTKTNLTENTLFSAKNSIVDSPITAIPILPQDKPRRNLLQTPTAAPIRPIDASIKRNHDLILNMYDMFPNGVVIIWYGLTSNIP